MHGIAPAVEPAQSRCLGFDVELPEVRPAAAGLREVCLLDDDSMQTPFKDSRILVVSGRFLFCRNHEKLFSEEVPSERTPKIESCKSSRWRKDAAE